MKNNIKSFKYFQNESMRFNITTILWSEQGKNKIVINFLFYYIFLLVFKNPFGIFCVTITTYVFFIYELNERIIIKCCNGQEKK